MLLHLCLTSRAEREEVTRLLSPRFATFKRVTNTNNATYPKTLKRVTNTNNATYPKTFKRVTNTNIATYPKRPPIFINRKASSPEPSPFTL